MSKNFDAARGERARRDRGFTIAGETFSIKAAVRPEVIAEWDAVTTDTPSEDGIAACERIVESFLETPEQYRRWTELRASELDGNPISVEDLVAVVQWMVEANTGHPTEPPASSTRGPQVTDSTPSTVASPSPVGASFGT